TIVSVAVAFIPGANILAMAIRAAAVNIGLQLTGKALGVVKDFSWRNVAAAAVGEAAGGVMNGLAGGTGLGGLLNIPEGFARGFVNGGVQAAAQEGAQSAIARTRFDPTAVAI